MAFRCPTLEELQDRPPATRTVLELRAWAEELFIYGGQAERAWVELPRIGRLIFQTFVIQVDRRGRADYFSSQEAQLCCHSWLEHVLQEARETCPQATHIMWRKLPEVDVVGWRLFARFALFGEHGQYLSPYAKQEGQKTEVI